MRESFKRGRSRSKVGTDHGKITIKLKPGGKLPNWVLAHFGRRYMERPPKSNPSYPKHVTLYGARFFPETRKIHDATHSKVWFPVSRDVVSVRCEDGTLYWQNLDDEPSDQGRKT